MKRDITQEDIRRAAINVGGAMAAFDASPTTPHIFSERHEEAMRMILSMEPGKVRRRPVLRGLAAGVIALIILFIGAYTYAPSVHAAVGEWFTKVWNNVVIYNFPHSGQDHAFPVIDPVSVPERFTLKQEKKGDGYRTLKYTDDSTGDHILFDYRWISQKQADKLEAELKTQGSVQVFYGYDTVLKESGNKTMLSWYEPTMLLGFKAESNLPAEELAQALSEVDWHLPEYVPTWIPEGFELLEEYRDPGCVGLTYILPETGDLLGLEYYDYGEMTSFTSFMTDADVIEEVVVNGFEASLGYTDLSSENYDPDNMYNGLTLVWTDTYKHLIFVVDGSIDRETAVKFAENLKIK